MEARSCRACHLPLTPSNDRKPRTWCSEACRVSAYRERLGLFTSRVASERNCDECGKPFMPYAAKARYCTPACGWMHRGKTRPPRETHEESCVVCGSVFMSVSSRTCSRACRSVLITRPTVRSCRNCGADTTRHPSRKAGPLCEACSETKRRVRNRRKRERRDWRRPERSISLRQLGEREGWRCHLCRRVVNPGVKWPDSKSATFDHLIPLVDGGSDEPENLRLAHLGCNSSRGAGGTVQLLLFG